MNGRSHATSGLATWLGGCVGLSALGHRPGMTTVFLGAGVCAGFTLLPDADHPGALVSRTFGRPSQWLAKWLARGCAHAYTHTMGPNDPPPRGGHRTLTHTVPFCAAAGGVVALACWLGGIWGVAVTMFIASGLALRGLLPEKERKAAGMVQRRTYRTRSGIRVTRTRLQLPWVAIGAAIAGMVCAFLPGERWAWVGLAAGAGCATHLLGDSLTLSGCPVLWPIPIAGRRWYPVGPPAVMRFRTGGWVEQAIIMPAFAIGATVAGWGIIVH